MEKYRLKEPKFADERGSFAVTFYKQNDTNKVIDLDIKNNTDNDKENKQTRY